MDDITFSRLSEVINKCESFVSSEINCRRNKRFFLKSKHRNITHLTRGRVNASLKRIFPR